MSPILLASVLGAMVANAAAATPCGRPDLLETFPADGGTDVPINAHLSARYAATAEYVNEEITFEHVGVGSELPRATFDATEGLLAFEPSEPLVPGDSYVIHWPGLRGLSSALAGKGGEVTFTAGSTADVDPPSFGGVRALTWDVERVDDDCTDALEDRFVFDLSLEPATDDGGRGMLTLLVFQSKGGSATASPAPILAQRFSDTASTVRVQRSIDSAAGNVCFAALARDASGRVSNSADREVCVSTVKPPFFYGCGVSRGWAENGGSHRVTVIALFVFAGVARHRASRGRRRA